MRIRRALTSLCFATAAFLAACAARHPVARPAQPSGEALFQSYCAGCHISRPGAPVEAPPLEDSPWVAGREDRLIRIATQGLRGPVEIGGKTYNQEMPAVAQALTDAQIASLVSYLRGRFAAVGQPVATGDVARVRAASARHIGYWTADELLREP